MRTFDEPTVTKSDPSPAVVRRPAAAAPTTTLAHLQSGAGNTAVQRAFGGTASRSPVLDVVGHGGGSALAPDVREDMESRLGADFSDVRIHTEGDAASSAAAVGAHAYTVGSDVVFGAGKFDTSSMAGRTMLAHELTHVVQQRSGPVSGTPTGDGVSVSDPSDRFEREAEATATRAVQASPRRDRLTTGQHRSTAQRPTKKSSPVRPTSHATRIVQRKVPEPGASAIAAITRGAKGPLHGYVRLLRNDLVRLTHIVGRLPSELQDERRAELRELRRRVDDLTDTHHLDDAAQALPTVVTNANALDTSIREQARSLDGTAPVVATSALPSIVKNENLDRAIKLLEDEVAPKLKEPDVREQIQGIFGAKATEATTRIGETIRVLRELYKATNGRAGRGRFILDPAIPASMGALGNNALRQIRVPPAALDAATKDPARLAPQLLHEGSHVIAASIIDYAYRAGGAHFLLPDSIAFNNAASYEQIAVELLEHERPDPLVVRSMRRLAVPPERLVVAELGTLVTRAWVRAYRLPSDPASARAVAKMLAIPTEPHAPEITAAFLRRLYDALETLMNVAQDFLRVQPTPNPGHVPVSQAADHVVTVWLPPADLHNQNVHHLMVRALQALCAYVHDQTATLFTGPELSRFVLDVVEHDQVEALEFLRAYVDTLKTNVAGKSD